MLGRGTMGVVMRMSEFSLDPPLIIHEVIKNVVFVRQHLRTFLRTILRWL